jgi:NDP-sugar pyrophosphorylase family protein
MADIRHALILTAGLGIRLHPLTLVRAKPAIPVAGEPIVRRITRWLAASGVADIVLNLHHLPATLTAVMGDGSDMGVRTRYSWEQPRVLGSAGGPRLALPLIDAGTFLIVNGDTLTDVDLSALAAAHGSASAFVTLALTPNREPLRYGGVLLDEQARVTGFVRSGPLAAGSFHFVGVQIAKADAFQSLDMGVPVNSIGDAYDRLIQERPGSIRGFVSQAAFWDIGTVADYVNTSRLFAGLLPGTDPAPAASIARDTRGVHIDPSARVSASILWDDITIGRDSVIDECIVTDRVSVPPRSAYRRSILIGTPDGVTALPLDQFDQIQNRPDDQMTRLPYG